MEKRKRPITYAEAVEAKKYAESLEKNIPGTEKDVEILHDQTTLSGVKIDTLPSGGTIYPEGANIYYSPLTFGEMKYLSGSGLSDIENITFFLSKIQANFPKEDITYFDFYYITVLIKLTTFGETDFNIIFECQKCKHMNKQTFKQEKILFEEIRVPLPVTVDLEDERKATFKPLTVGNYMKMIKRGLGDDYDAYMAYCLQGYSTHTEALEVIKKDFAGESVNILETIDMAFYHGVQDLDMKCNKKHKVKTGEINEDGEEITVEEVCGTLHAIPFLTLPEHAIPSDSTKESLRNRIHFGI